MVQIGVENVKIASYKTQYHRAGKGNDQAILFLHGSGPGVSALSNWEFALPELGRKYDCIAPNLYGFGNSEHPQDPPNGVKEWLELWIEQSIELLDSLDLQQVDLVGNSMGGAIALQLISKYPERFRKVVLMGPVGVPFKITHWLEQGWGFYRNASKELLVGCVRAFVHDPESIGGNIEAIAEKRWDTVMNEHNKRSFQAMFSGDLQQQLDDLVVPESALKEITHSILLTHGREDKYIPLHNSLYLEQILPNAQLHVFKHCGHWIQIEKRKAFNRLLDSFFAGELD